MRTLALLALIESTAAAGGYVVLDGAGPRDAYHEAARVVAAHHEACIVRFDPEKPRDCLAELRRIRPEFVALVVRPEQLDFNLARAVLQLSTEVDDDPFVDFSFGYITGATAKEAAAFARRCVEAKPVRRPLRFGKMYGRSGKSAEETGRYPLRERDVDSLGIAVGGDGKSHDREFAKRALKELQSCPVVMFIGHGWPREVANACDFRDLPGLRLDGAVVLNVACYTGVTSGFFKDDWKAGALRRERVPLDESFCLGILRSGVVGYTAYTCGRPAGPELDTDVSMLVEGGLSLGEARRRDYDKTVLGYLGYRQERLDLKPRKDGSTLHRASDAVYEIMLEGATGGVLFGDPAYVPFPREGGPRPVGVRFEHGADGVVTVEARCRGKALFVQCNDPTAKAGKTMAMKVYARVPLKKPLVKKVEVQALEVGRAEPQPRLIWAVETDGEQHWLQLKVMFPRPTMGGDLFARVRVETTRDARQGKNRGGEPRAPAVASKDVTSNVMQPFMLEAAQRYKVSKEALQAALDASAAIFRADATKLAKLSRFKSEGFRATCALIEVGHHHYRTLELLRATYQPGDEKHLLALARAEGLPNFASWTVLEGLGLADTKEVRTYLLERLMREDDAGEFMGTAKGLALLKEERAAARVGEQILAFQERWGGVEVHLLNALAGIGGKTAKEYLEKYLEDERATHKPHARALLKGLQ